MLYALCMHNGKQSSNFLDNITVCISMEKFTLIITEKPDTAQRIALALDIEGRAQKWEKNKVPYYAAKRDKEIIVVPALGHLYTVAGEKSRKNYYPVFNFKWVPRYAVEKKSKQIRIWLSTISKLANKADMFIDACDYDIEGSIVGYCILKYACGGKEGVSKRMKYSTLTKEEVEKSYTGALAHLDFALIEAGLTRHEVDWLYGINLSRALTISARNWSGKYTTLSTGRVQGPSLKFLVEREKSRKYFVPTPYWRIWAEVEVGSSIFKAQYEKKTVKRKTEANSIVTMCKRKRGEITKLDIRKFQQKPPIPFDLGGLQSEAYSIFRYTPIHTSKIAQRLYLKALISYPRTSSQKLPPTINYKAILKSLHKVPEYKKLAEELLAKLELKPMQGKKKDPAHPAIYPTGNLPEKGLGNTEKNVLDIVVRRFMAVFGEPAIMQRTKVTINVNGNHFFLREKQTLRDGWFLFYKPYMRSDETLLPAIKEKQGIKIKNIILEQRFTKPLPRYNSITLLKRMEQEEIGTKATRANIIQRLYDRKYVREETMVVTNLGFAVFEILEKYCPKVVSLKLTRELEERMKMIRMNIGKRDDVLFYTIEILKSVMGKLKEKEKIIGEKLSKAIKRARLEERTVGMCPVCKSGQLIILYSKRTNKRFVGCSNYFKGLCKTSFPLPQKGIIKPLRKNCHICGWPTLHIHIKRMRPWVLCINTKCPSKEKGRKSIGM